MTCHFNLEQGLIPAATESSHALGTVIIDTDIDDEIISFNEYTRY